MVQEYFFFWIILELEFMCVVKIPTLLNINQKL